jgi:hypothetical protein
MDTEINAGVKDISMMLEVSVDRLLHLVGNRVVPCATVHDNAAMKFESTIFIQHLNRFEIDEDGSTINLIVTDLVGRELTLALPIEAISSLMMTLPRMINGVVKRRDPSLRVVYPLGHHTCEFSKDGSTRILTLQTRDGFEVAFSISPQQTDEMAASLDPQIERHRDSWKPALTSS